MALYQNGEAARQGLDIQLAIKAERHGDVVVPAVRSEPVENPEGSLREGNGTNKLIPSFSARSARDTLGWKNGRHVVDQGNERPQVFALKVEPLLQLGR